ncbi:hypothetical protein [Geodermatophilus sabuli]|uniref:Uncharacterized protein n=1 Tax=Geodermatophilus sabuli TaxID=1564158 RepID=A0A285EFV5_9ACTN|nr:hypothetical protein [Geodermatophilus sabuli]MBB3083025.1 hypothetical protein [Geodermatophilus sabuli]SNX98022.1 hypothetical protein SAMN06893097_109102 [Geodermatophilus sabuli]
MSRRLGARAGAGLLVVAAAAWLALVEVFWLPLRVAGVLVPVSVVAAVTGNLLLVPLAHRLTGSRLVAALPALVWLTVAVAGSIRRPEGDLLVTGGGATGLVNLAFLLCGVVAAAFAVGRVLAAASLSPRRTGSGTGGAR